MGFTQEPGPYICLALPVDDIGVDEDARLLDPHERRLCHPNPRDVAHTTSTAVAISGRWKSQAMAMTARLWHSATPKAIAPSTQPTRPPSTGSHDVR